MSLSKSDSVECAGGIDCQRRSVAATIETEAASSESDVWRTCPNCSLVHFCSALCQANGKHAILCDRYNQISFSLKQFQSQGLPEAAFYEAQLMQRIGLTAYGIAEESNSYLAYEKAQENLKVALETFRSTGKGPTHSWNSCRELFFACLSTGQRFV